MLLFSRNFSPNKITFTTESNYAGNRLIFLLQNLYMPIIEKQSALRTKSSDSHLYKIIVVDGNDCKRIFEDFGHTDGQITLRVNRANLSSEELSQSFLRGVFLSCGSVSDPMKSYHLEFCVPHKNSFSGFVQDSFRNNRMYPYSKNRLSAAAVTLSILRRASRFVTCLPT